jgi:hypothetical protein
MIPVLTLLATTAAVSCGTSDPCRTVEAYLRALKAMDQDRLESYIDPAFRSRRDDGTDAPFDRVRNRGNREFERATKTRWTYRIIGIDGERITAFTTEDNDYYRLLGVGVRTQVTVYAARNGRLYFAQNFVTVDQHGRYLDAYQAFLTWLEQQPAGKSDAEVIRGGRLVFSSASAPKLLMWLKRYRSSGAAKP